VARERLVLRYQGEGAPSATDVERVRDLPDSVIVDSSPRMLLVECEPERLGALVEELPGWVMTPEQTYEVPDVRQRVVGPPE
jgi:hypothetical protein